jgi:high affinity Mn2+ porin
MGLEMKGLCRFGSGTGLVLATYSVAITADLPRSLPVKAPIRSVNYEWTGFYVGGHFGYGDASFGPGTNPIPLQGVFLPHSPIGLIGGFQAGYNRQFSNRVVLGVEADASFPSPIDVPRLAPAPFNTSIDYVGTLRGRIGYAFGPWMPYLTGGFAWGHTHVLVNDDAGGLLATVKGYQTGWTAGAGVEFAVSGNWSAKLEYDYIDLSRRTYDLGGFGLPGVNVDPRIHLAKLGLNYRLGDTRWNAATGDRTARPDSDAWNVHAQTTILPQGYPSFRSPYEGTNSLPGRGQVQTTWTTTAFLGVRLWDGGEFYFNPELAQGQAADPALDINTVMTSIQHANLKYGFYANFEQQIAKDVGLFARASWNDGQNQILSFTDIDRSLSGGLSIKGSYWGRPNDTIGIGGAINGLSAANRDFLAAGGLGLLIGDGQLNYRPERLLETYYAYSLNKNVTSPPTISSS